MTTAIAKLVDLIDLGESVSEAGLTLMPVFGQFRGVPEFISLSEAVASRTLVVTEVSEAGWVPSLKAVNKGTTGVLILDGEEVAGAKQNRVLNTSVYIQPGQEIIIPVSCTEAGRWSYRTSKFTDSGHISVHAIRLAANESVTTSVRQMTGFVSDQGRVWSEVAQLQRRHKMSSPTSAARDVYESRGEAMRRREASFKCLPGQTGVLALWHGHAAGLDVVGRAEVYSKVHERLVRSYAIDAPDGRPSSAEHDRRAARDWLAALRTVVVTEHESPGNGLSYRFTGEGVLGSALAVDGTILHAVAFATATGPEIDEESDSGASRYPGFFERRAHFPW
jgi:hypothetical protein